MKFSEAERRQRYVKHPYFCPFCGHGAIEATKTDAFENMMYQWVRCDECEAEWHDCYELVGFEEVVAPAPPRQASENNVR
tara:strand:- start:1866 stop:2105 length:240 start_codon:yes stop_codon:yes gene_type:complete